MEYKLLSREEFKKQVFARTNGKCCVPNCDCDAVDAHHIMDRRLWKDGGYYLSNGAALCSKHHLDDDDGSLKLALENQKLLIMAKYGECNVKNNTVRSNLVK